MKRPTVEQIMTTDVVTVHPGTTFRDVVATLDDHHIGGLPVIDHDGRVVGVVSEADLLPKEAATPLPVEPKSYFTGRRYRRERAKAQASTAEQAMTSPALTITPDATIVQAARLLTRHGITRLPVTDPDGRLVGIVSRADVLRVFLKPDEQIRDEIIREVVMRSLWQDPHDVQVDVHDGIVTLRGRLDVASLVPIAEELTSAIDGVVAVTNELTFERDDTTERIDPQTLRYRG